METWKLTNVKSFGLQFYPTTASVAQITFRGRCATRLTALFISHDYNRRSLKCKFFKASVYWSCDMCVSSNLLWSFHLIKKWMKQGDYHLVTLGEFFSIRRHWCTVNGSGGSRISHQGGTNLLFGQNLPETVWKNIGLGRGWRPKFYYFTADPPLKCKVMCSNFC